MFFVVDRGENDGHCVIDAFYTAVGARMVGACGNFVDAAAIVESAEEFKTQWNVIVGNEGNPQKGM